MAGMSQEIYNMQPKTKLDFDNNLKEIAHG